MTDTAHPVDGSLRNGIAQRVARGSLLSLGASFVTLVLGLTRSILLARLLQPEHFGLLALALFFLSLAAQLRSLGLDRALIHLQGSEDNTLGTYFSLRMGLLFASLIPLLAAIPILAKLYPNYPLLGRVIPMLACLEVFKTLSSVQETLLRKDFAFRSIAITDVAASVAMTVVAPLLAWVGWGAWALVAEQASGILTRFLVTMLVFRRWWPRCRWSRSVARWFWRYGRSAWIATNLESLLDRFPDFWVGSLLGGALLGYYTQAIELTRYPRRVVGNPLVAVFGPTFARLQEDRLRLSQAFYRAAYVILRLGLLISAALALVMPEFISVVIGPQWQPMLLVFRLLLVYALLDSLLVLCSSLLMALGLPQVLVRSRRIQAMFFIPAAIAGASLWGINGVAVAADLMMVLGSCMLYREVTKIVDFSLARLSLLPFAAFTVGLIAGFLVETLWQPDSQMLSALAKLALLAALYVGILAIAERRDCQRALRWAWRVVLSGHQGIGDH